MISSTCLIHVLLTLFLLYSNNITLAQVGSSPIKNEEENAIHALQATFNDNFLNNNWTGHLCSNNESSNWYGIQCSNNGHVTGIILEGMKLTGKIKPNAFNNFTELAILSFKDNNLFGNIMDFSLNQKLKKIDLSSNIFYGNMSTSLTTLSLLESLQLQDNGLTGPIPEFNQALLKLLNVSNNNLTGPIPNTQLLRSFGPDLYSGNPGLCGQPLAACLINDIAADQSDHDDQHQKDSLINRYAVYFLIFDVIAFLALIWIFILYQKKDKKLKEMLKKKQDIEENKEKKLEEGDHKRAIVRVQERGNLTFVDNEAEFDMKDLLKASAELLGNGILGNSYKATLEGKPTVVVKRLRELRPISSEEFTKHWLHISNFKHPNLLPLHAFYCSKNENLLVYKYADKGNLYNRLHEGRGSGNRIPFQWSTRLLVAQSVARALEYLQLNTPSTSNNIVPHGNLKASNILFDENESVLVSDYGVASLVASPIAAQRMVSYKSPEYRTTKRVSKESDIWSYGCLLLELLTAKVAAYTAPPGVNGIDICNWVNRAVREEWTAEIFDREISVRRSANPGMLRLLQIAIRCCERSPEKRPKIQELVREVENIEIVNVEENLDDMSSNRSFTDDSFSTTGSGIVGIDDH